MENVDERVPAKGCNGHYEINRLGEIFNAETGRKLKLQINMDGYLQFWDCRVNGVRKHRYVAIISALSFDIPNPDNKPTVNHINGDKTDNRPENLEWATYSEQLLHSYRVLGRVPTWLGKVGPNKGKPRPEGSGKPSRPVRATHLKTGEVREFESIHEAARQVGGNNRHICEACQGKLKSYAGYLWEYIPKINQSDIQLDFALISC